MSIEIKKENKVIFPDQLIIIIRTSIPGFQKIEYKPSMTIKGSYEKGVVFDPLMKLNQSTIDKIPQEYRIKQFFNKGLFQSLLNYNGGTPAKNLLEATRYGYVDNNINVTLNSIFPVGSVIYINNNSYVIADHQWTPGDWKIGIKDKFRVSEEKFTKGRELTGEEEFKSIPESILFGINYSGPPIQKKKTLTASSPTTSTPFKTNIPTTSIPTPTSTPTGTGKIDIEKIMGKIYSVLPKGTGKIDIENIMGKIYSVLPKGIGKIEIENIMGKIYSVLPKGTGKIDIENIMGKIYSVLSEIFKNNPTTATPTTTTPTTTTPTTTTPTTTTPTTTTVFNPLHAATTPTTTTPTTATPTTTTPTTTTPTTTTVFNPLHAADLKLENLNMQGGQYRPNYYQPYPYYYKPYPNYYQPYPYYSKQNYITKTDSNSSKLAYIITIDMELRPGTSLTPEQINNSKCNSRYNAIRKSYSTLTGTPYVIPPLYIDSKIITEKNKQEVKGGRTKRRKTRKTRKTRKMRKIRKTRKTQRNMK